MNFSILNAYILKEPRQTIARCYGLSNPRHLMFDVIDDFTDELLVAELSGNPGVTLRDGPQSACAPRQLAAGPETFSSASPLFRRGKHLGTEVGRVAACVHACVRGTGGEKGSTLRPHAFWPLAPPAKLDGALNGPHC